MSPAFPALMKPNRIAPAALLLALGACKAPDVPRSPAPWVTLGASNHIVTSLDTSRIVVEPTSRIVWVRQARAARTEQGVATGALHSETRHRIDCGARTVTDLEPAGATHPFDRHPFGKRVFPTVCNALGNLPARPSNG